jgi:proteic killer suppression protein
MLDYASDLRDLSSPGNNLEKLKGALAGTYSIRINDQFRIVFNFDRGETSNVVIADYHR